MSDAKAVVCRFIEEVWNNGNLDVADELVHPDYANSEGQGAAAVKRNVQAFRGAFPDLRVTVERVVAEGDVVVAQMVLRGTHLGRFRRQYDATGRTAIWDEVGIWRVEDGRLRSGWFVADAFGLRKQLGVISEDMR